MLNYFGELKITLFEILYLTNESRGGVIALLKRQGLSIADVVVEVMLINLDCCLLAAPYLMDCMTSVPCILELRWRVPSNSTTV